MDDGDGCVDMGGSVNATVRSVLLAGEVLLLSSARAIGLASGSRPFRSLGRLEAVSVEVEVDVDDEAGRLPLFRAK